MSSSRPYEEANTAGEGLASAPSLATSGRCGCCRVEQRCRRAVVTEISATRRAAGRRPTRRLAVHGARGDGPECPPEREPSCHGGTRSVLADFGEPLNSFQADDLPALLHRAEAASVTMLWPGDSAWHQKPSPVHLMSRAQHQTDPRSSMSPWATGEWRRYPLPALSRPGVDEVSSVFPGVGRCEAGEAAQRVVLTNHNSAELVSRDERPPDQRDTAPLPSEPDRYTFSAPRRGCSGSRPALVVTDGPAGPGAIVKTCG
jgi:hypothetical protein